MTIAIIVEDGTGTNPAANSYESIADFRARAATIQRAIPVADDDCAALMLKAMAYIEQQDERFSGQRTLVYNYLQSGAASSVGYITSIDGLFTPLGQIVPAANNQPLAWPRTGAYSKRGWMIAPTELPLELIKAQFNIACLYYDQAQNPANYSNTGPVTELTNEVMGAVKQTTRYANPSANPGIVRPVAAMQKEDWYLACLYKAGGQAAAQVSRG